jgi:hypothetical protein
VVRVTNCLGEGVEPKSLSMGVRFVKPSDGCPPLPFIDAREEGKKETREKLQCLAVGMSSRALLSVWAH